MHLSHYEQILKDEHFIYSDILHSMCLSGGAPVTHIVFSNLSPCEDHNKMWYSNEIETCHICEILKQNKPTLNRNNVWNQTDISIEVKLLVDEWTVSDQ